MKDVFRKIATKISVMSGTAIAFLLAFSLIVVWALTGPVFNFSNTWQLVINTTTTIVTFLMVFLIQNTQNRDSKAMQLKLDELIRATTARDSFVDLEDLDDSDLEQLDKEFKKLHDAQQSSPLMHKLHAHVAAVHKNRLTLKSAGRAFENIITNQKK